MDLTGQSHLEPTVGGTKRKRNVLWPGSPPLRPNPPWNPKENALSHLFESEVADDVLVPLSRNAAKCTVMEVEEQAELLRRKQVSNSKAESAQDKLFARLKKLSEAFQRTTGIEHLPLDKSESISKIFDCVIQWWDHANTAREESNQKASEAQRELQNKCNLLIDRNVKQKKEIASLTRELKEVKRTQKESNRKTSEARGEIHNKCDSLLAEDSKQKEEIASLTKQLKEANELKDSASEVQTDLENQYNTVAIKHNALADEYSKQKKTIASLNRELEKVDQSKYSWDESNRNASEVQRELQNKHDSLLAKDSKQTEEIASLTKELQEVNQSKRTLEESDRKASKAKGKLQSEYDSLYAKYSKQKETVASLNGEIEKVNQARHVWKKEAIDLREVRDDMSEKLAFHLQERDKARIELDELRKVHKSASDEAASLLADKDRYYEEAKQTRKAQADLKQCQNDLRQSKIQLESMLAEPSYHKDYRAELCKSRALQKEKGELEAKLEQLEKANQLDSHMWKQEWEAVSFENENTKRQLQGELETSNNLQDEVNGLHELLANCQKELDGQRKEMHHDRKGFKIEIAKLKGGAQMCNKLQDEVENLHKQLGDRQKELNSQRMKSHNERKASETQIGKLEKSYNDSQRSLKSMKEEHEAEMQRQRLSYDEDKSNNERAAIANLNTQLEQQRESLREKHDADMEVLKANNKLKADLLLSSCNADAAKQAEEFNRQLKEEKENVSKLADDNQECTRRTEFYQRELRGSQKSLEEAHEMINQLCFIAVVLRKKNMASLTQREVILSKAVETANALEVKLITLQDELNTGKLDLTTMQSTLKRKETEADAGSKLLQETAERLAQLDRLHSACAHDRRLQLGYFDRQTLLADFSELTTTLAESRRFRGEASGREVEVCLGFLQGHKEAVCLIQGVEDRRCLQILQLAMGDCSVVTHCWGKWIRLGRDKPLYIAVSKVDDKSWMERHLPSGPCSSEDLKALV